jgi:hypothetical protein
MDPAERDKIINEALQNVPKSLCKFLNFKKTKILFL